VSKRGQRIVYLGEVLRADLLPILPSDQQEEFEEFLLNGEDFALEYAGVAHGELDAREVDRRAANEWVSTALKLQRQYLRAEGRAIRAARQARPTA
jgi:hypothetical protein